MLVVLLYQHVHAWAIILHQFIYYILGHFELASYPNTHAKSTQVGQYLQDKHADKSDAKISIAGKLLARPPALNLGWKMLDFLDGGSIVCR